LQSFLRVTDEVPHTHTKQVKLQFCMLYHTVIVTPKYMSCVTFSKHLLSTFILYFPAFRWWVMNIHIVLCVYL
jgi:hypothetical protein